MLIIKLLKIKIGYSNITHVHLIKKEPRPLCEFYNTSLIPIKHLECTYLAEERKIIPHLTNLEEIVSLKNFNLLMY